MTTVKIEVVQGVEGKALYINNIRVAGPKPWGGGTCIASWNKARIDWILEALPRNDSKNHVQTR